MKVKTAILPVAGLGSRIMPLTLHQPKAMIGIVDRPMIHYVVDEVIAAGINKIIIVAGPSQKEFKKYFEHFKNNREWKRAGVHFSFIIQKTPRGNADAVYLARNLIGKKPFLVCFADDLLVDDRPPMKRLVEIFKKTSAPAIVLETVPKKQVYRYGVVAAEQSKSDKDLYLIKDIVEKPPVKLAPSNLTIVGRYALNYGVLQEIKKLYPYKGKEIGLADALKNYSLKGSALYGWRFHGKRFDAGSKIGILKAQAYFGIKHKEFGRELREYLKKEL